MAKEKTVETGLVKAGETTGTMPYFIKGEVPQKGFKVVSLAPIVKLTEMPDNSFLSGRILGLVDSPVPRIKSKLIRFETPQGEILITANRALAMIILQEDSKNGTTCKYEGKNVVIQRIGTRKGKSGHKNFPIFKVAVED